MAQTPERFQHRSVRFSGAEVHHALTASVGRVGTLGEMLQEEVDERSLAHAGLACEKNQATFAAIRFEKTIDEVLQLSFTANDRP
jgi:hypothetical protein